MRNGRSGDGGWLFDGESNQNRICNLLSSNVMYSTYILCTLQYKHNIKIINVIIIINNVSETRLP